MLLNAFTRALRDGFPPARVAGLKAIVATGGQQALGMLACRSAPWCAWTRHGGCEDHARWPRWLGGIAAVTSKGISLGNAPHVCSFALRPPTAQLPALV